MVEEIARLLGAAEPGPVESITRIIATLGEEQTPALVQQGVHEQVVRQMIKKITQRRKAAKIKRFSLRLCAFA